MGQFVEDTVLWTAPREFGDKKDCVRLEQGEYKENPTFNLREMWQTPDGEYRWSQVRADKNGKYWSRFGIKAAELRGLGEALIAAADAVQGQERRPGATNAGGRPGVVAGQRSRTSPPREVAEQQRFDDQTRSRGRVQPRDEDDTDLPF